MTRWERLAAAGSVILGAVLTIGLGVRLSSAEEPAKPDLSELRDAVRSASKRGANVDEIGRALDALEKKLGQGWKAPGPKDPPPTELQALRDAVEAAGRKGEDVDEIRKQLAAVEKALIGRVLDQPKPPPPAVAKEPRVRPRIPDLPPLAGIGPAFPDLPVPLGVRGPNRELLQKAEKLRAKALELMGKDATDEEAMKLLQEAQELMLQALGANFDLFGGFGPLGARQPERFRLGVRVERLAPITAEQLNLEGKGVAIASVIPGSVADTIGLKANDIVLEFAGKPLSDDPQDLIDRVNAVKAGEKVDLVVLRKGKRLEFKGVELPEPAPDPQDDDVFPLFPPLGGFGGLGGFGAGGFGDASGNSVSVSVVNGRFTINAIQNNVKYLIVGELAEDGPQAEKISITPRDGKAIEAKELKEVPEDYRPTVERLLKSIRGRAGRR